MWWPDGTYDAWGPSPVSGTRATLTIAAKLDGSYDHTAFSSTTVPTSHWMVVAVDTSPWSAAWTVETGSRKTAREVGRRTLDR